MRYLDREALVLGPGVRTGLSIAIDNPHELGADRIANAVAAFRRHGGPCIVVDFGTATTFDAVSAAGEYLGGVIAPGIETSLDALASRAARLVKVDLVAPARVIGKSTVECMRSGVVYGTVAMVDGVVARIKEELGPDALVIATGGLADLVCRHSAQIDENEPLLTLEGLRIVHELNPGRVSAARDGRMKKRMRQILAERAAAASDGASAGPPPERWPVAEPFEIGGLRLENRLVQAPLAGIANWAFRRQSRRHGAGLAVSEMIASFGIRYANRKTIGMLAIAPDEHPVGVQVFGADPGAMAEAARAAEEAGADLVDVNMGCPVPKICKTGAGRRPARRPRGAPPRVVEAMARAVDIPVTVKMRRGLTPSTAVPVETARRLEAAGAAALCVHPRAAAEEYEGTADHRITAEVVEAVAVPVIASGDVSTPERARRVLEDTGCAAIAIGRAALGYPWAFGDILRGVPRPLPTLAEVVEELSGFAADVRLALGDGRACGYMRKFYPWYLAGHGVPQADLEDLLTTPTLDGALARLRSLAAAPAAA